MPTLVWSSLFVFLVAELAVTVILVTPVPRKIRNLIAKQIFKLNLGERLSTPLLFVGLMISFAFLESFFALKRLHEKHLEEQSGLSLEQIQSHLHLSSPHHHHDRERKYRAERNMYMAGFALTLLFVLRRILQLMQESVEIEAELERVVAAKPSTDIAIAPEDETAKQIELKPIKPKKPLEKKKD